MPGTKAGGAKLAKILKEKYGDDYFAKIGKLSKTSKGGFASEKIGKDGMTGKERSRYYANKQKEVSGEDHETSAE